VVWGVRRERECLSRGVVSGKEGQMEARWERGRGDEVLLGLYSSCLAKVWPWVSELLARAWC
jgi:hypothetical protein